MLIFLSEWYGDEIGAFVAPRWYLYTIIFPVVVVILLSLAFFVALLVEKIFKKAYGSEW
jgi:membrane protein implicated in regulation of membrane protease activity